MPIINIDNKQDKERYMNYLNSVKDIHFAQDPRWAKVQDNMKCEYVTLEKDGKIICAASIYVKPIFLGYSLLYAKRGPITKDQNPQIILELINEIKPLIKKYNAFAIRFDPNFIYSDELVKNYTKNGFKVRSRGLNKVDLIMSRITMTFKIKNRNMDELMSMFKPRTRRHINKSFRSDLIVERGVTKEKLDIFMKLLDITAKRDSIEHKPREFFEKIFDNFPREIADLYMVKKDDKYLSGALGINYSGRFFYYIGASSNELRELEPNARMQYEMINEAVKTGCDTYDMGSIITEDISDGLYFFKSGYCTEDLPEEYIGEIDYPFKKFIYFVFIKAYTIAQHYLLKKALKRIAKNSKNEKES